MEPLVLVITIAEKKLQEKLITFFGDNDISMTLTKFGKGTASDEMLDLLGIGEKEKCILFNIMMQSKGSSIIKALERKMKENLISMMIPIQTYNENETKKEGENGMNEISKELIVVVSKRGFTDLIMDAARSAGARGGTVIHARGTSSSETEKFFGATIGDDKEMTFIVASSIDKKQIMENIYKSAGNNSPAESILFSLPIVDQIGMNL